MKKTIKKIYLNRKKRYLKKIFGIKTRPRISVFRSNKHIYAQLIDDKLGLTLTSCSTLDKSIKQTFEKANNKQAAFQIGIEIALRAKQKEIQFAVFDKGNNAYHGRVKNLADGAREGGLIF